MRQAPISGVVTLAVCAAMVAATVWWGRFVARKTADQPEEGKYPACGGDVAFFARLSVLALAITTSIFVAGRAESVVAAFFNPEFWALKRLLG